MIEGGFIFRGGSLNNFNTHEIDITNTLNGKVVYFLRNQTGILVPPGVGQVILANCTDITVENQETTFTIVGIELAFSSNINISNCNVSNSTYGIFSYSSNWNSFTNNTVLFSSPNGFYMEYSSNNTISENTFLGGPPNEYGIYIRYSNYNVIANNTFSNLYNGITFKGVSESIIIDNIIISNSYRGVDFWDSSDSNQIVNCTISDNEMGIRLDYSYRNTIYGNYISNNTQYGLWFTSSRENTIFHNTIFNNSNQAYDNQANNIWHKGYPGGGNFWSDYSGSDNYFGPDQDILGSDGIGDTSYLIDSNSKDKYPLMSPFDLWIPPQDDIPPIIFDVSVVNITETEASIIWSTDEYATSRLRWSEYPDLSLPSSLDDLSYTQNHSITLTSLTYNKTYYFEITSVDPFGNPTIDNNGSLYYRFSSLPGDEESPTIEEVYTIPRLPEINKFTAIYANITDNSEVFGAWIGIIYPGGLPYGNYSMTQNAEGLFQFNRTYTFMGTYSFIIWVNDTSDNWNSYSGMFDVQDRTPPTFTNFSVESTSQYVFSNVVFSAKVTDDYQLSRVYVNITNMDNGTYDNFSLSYSYSTRSYSIDVYYALPGNFSCVFWAKDASDNWNSTSSSVLYFEILDDLEPPTINDITRDDSYEFNEWVTIEAIITDNVAVVQVWVEVFLPGISEPLNNSIFVSYNNRFRHSSSYTTLGRHNYTIWATDRRGNLVASNGSFTMEDNIDPHAEARIQGQATTYAQGIEVTFDGTGSWDNHRIENFTWSFFDDGEEVLFYGSFPNFAFVSPTTHTVVLTVRDPSGNTATDSVIVWIIEVDNDNDGLSDYDEEHIYKTDPDKKDTDGDGLEDGDEVEQGTDPTKYDIIYWWLLVIEAIFVILLIFLAKRESRKHKMKSQENDESQESPEEEEESEDGLPPPPPPMNNIQW
jgi:parallel beta-helix repeat protein